MSKTSIIIADGRPAQRNRLKKLLSAGFPLASIAQARNRDDLRSCLTPGTPHCVLVDGAFVDGVHGAEETAMQLREATPSSYVVWLLPRETDLAAWRVLLEKTPGDFLLRPFSEQELIARVGWCLAAGARPGLQQANRVLAGLVEERSHDLYESDERFRLLFNACSDGIFTLALHQGKGDDRIIEVNNQLCHVLNYPREELLALQPKDILAPQQVSYVIARLKNLETQKLMHMETILVTRDGKKIPASITARHFAFTRQPYVVFIVHPHQRTVLPDGSPANLDQAYSTYAAQTGQIMYEYLIPENRLRLTGATRQITGLSQSDLETSDQDKRFGLIHPDDYDEVLQKMRQAVADMAEYHIQYRVRHTSGEYRHVEDLGIVVPDESGAPHRMLGYIRDITDRIRAEQEERLIEQEIQHSKRLESLGVLAGGIAHDFNNILAAIIGLTDMSLQELEGPPDVVEDLQESLRAAHRAKDLVKQILAFSRQAGEERTPVYLHVVVREALGLLRASIPASIQIIDNVDVHSGMVMANPTQMHQVIMNYCTNGIQAMSDKGGTLEVRVEDVEITRRFAETHPKLHHGPYVKLTVADKGHGIEPSHIKRIFDPFYTTKGPGEGTGMGLAMVYGIVADHGGAVLVESVVGQGTEFQTYFPRVATEVQAEGHTDDVKSGGRESLMVVDDEHAVRRFCRRSLTQLGYRVHTSGEPREALEEFKRNPDGYDLIITDQHMPGMTGDALAKRVRKVRADIPIILFTGYSSEVNRDAARDAGISEIVPKPILASQLTTAIRRVLDGKR